LDVAAREAIAVRAELWRKGTRQPIGSVTLLQGEGILLEVADPADRERLQAMFDKPLEDEEWTAGVGYMESDWMEPDLYSRWWFRSLLLSRVGAEYEFRVVEDQPA
jgi:hypothetical protein